MKNKILLCGLIIVMLASIMLFGCTQARYYFTASMTGEIDYIKTIGQISLYNPETVEGYKELSDGGKGFEALENSAEFTNITYQVTNKVNDEINEEEVNYYIRIVAEDDSNNIPIEYNVYKYQNLDKAELKEDVGYGPFQLEIENEDTKQYLIEIKWNSLDSNYISSVQHLKVQMIKINEEGTLKKVIAEIPLNIECKVNDIETSEQIVDPQTIDMSDDTPVTEPYKTEDIADYIEEDIGQEETENEAENAQVPDSEDNAGEETDTADDNTTIETEEPQTTPTDGGHISI